jgi:hypothetical protein
MTYSREFLPTQPVAEQITPAKPVNRALASYLRQKLASNSAGPTQWDIVQTLSDEQLVAAYERYHAQTLAKVQL